MKLYKVCIYKHLWPTRPTRPHGVPHGTTRPRPQCHTAQHGHGLSMSHGTWPATRPTRPCHRGLRVNFLFPWGRCCDVPDPTRPTSARGAPDAPGRSRVSAYGAPDAPGRSRVGAHGAPNAPGRSRVRAHGAPDAPGRSRVSVHGAPHAPGRSRVGAHGAPNATGNSPHSYHMTCLFEN